MADSGALVNPDSVCQVERGPFIPNNRWGQPRGGWIYALVQRGRQPCEEVRLQYVDESYQMADELVERWRAHLEQARGGR